MFKNNGYWFGPFHVFYSETWPGRVSERKRLRKDILLCQSQSQSQSQSLGVRSENCEWDKPFRPQVSERTGVTELSPVLMNSLTGASTKHKQEY